MPEHPESLLSIIVPTYNESANIVRLVRCLLDASDAREVLVVDDASPDGTADLVRETFAGDPRVRLVLRTTDRGLAKSIRAGIEHSRGEIVAVMDSDFNHDPAAVSTMRALLEHFDIVVGSRFVAGGGMEDSFRYYCSSVYNTMLRVALGTRIQDNLSGFFAIRRAALAQMPLDEIFFGYGDYFFRLLSKAADFRMSVVEIPVFYRLRVGGESKTKYFGVLSEYTRALFSFVAKEGLKHRHLEPLPSHRVIGNDVHAAPKRTDQ